MATGAEPLTLLQRSFLDRSHPPTPPNDYESIRDVDAKTPPMEVTNHPPTPDQTPQALKAPRPPLFPQYSSYAESFTTAEEDFSRGPTPVAHVSRVPSQEELREELINGNGAHDESADELESQIEDGRWMEIPGAFRNTPSIASSRPETRSKQYVDYQSTPSTKSSKHVRAKSYLTVPDSASSTGSSECLTRPKSYHEDPESPLGHKGRSDEDGWVDHVADVNSQGGNENVGNDDDGTNGRAENEPAHMSANDHEPHDWDKHVSYIAFDDAPVEGGAEQQNESMKEEQPSSGRLSGQGRRVGNGEELKSLPQQLQEDQPATPKDLSPKEHSPSLRKTGHLADHHSTAPNVKIRSRKHLHAEVASLKETQLREDKQREAAQTLASSRIPREFLTAPPRNSTDEVYQQIQRANMERFAALEEEGAVGALVIPTEDTQNRSLRHVSKQQSLRSVHASAVADGAPPSRPLRAHHSLRRDGRQVSLTGQPHQYSYDSPAQNKRRSASGPVANAPQDNPSPPTLRHEKRPLSRTSRHDLQERAPTSANRALARALLIEKHRQEQEMLSSPARDTKQAVLPLRNGVDAPEKVRDAQDHGVKHSSRDQRSGESTSLGPQSPWKKENIGPHPSFPPPALPAGASSLSDNLAKIRTLNSGKTPVSMSGMSDKTDIQVCEAQNMAIYPHSNESVLVVQQGTSPNSKDKSHQNNHSSLNAPRNTEPVGAQLAAMEDTPAPSFALNDEAVDNVNSPLTNPLEPPAIQFIPPTPAEEEDRQLVSNEEPTRQSLTQRARRYSGIVIRPLVGRAIASRHRSVSPSPRMADKQNNLHPNWVPSDFWDDDDADYYSDPEDMAVNDRLPPGGDTSEHPRRRRTFPRKMSVRMPGFRGRGGFHLGNSLGIDRHGTNTRRHHVELPSSSQSRPDLRSRFMKEPKHVVSTDSMRALALAGAQHRFKIPMTKVNLEYVRSGHYRLHLHIIKRARIHSDHLVTREAREQARRNLERRNKTETGYAAAEEALFDADWVAGLQASKKKQDDRLRARYNLQHDNSTEEVLWNIMED